MLPLLACLAVAAHLFPSFGSRAPRSFVQLVESAHAELEAGSLPAAREQFESALHLRPRNANCAYALACVDSRAGDLAQAAQWFASAAEWGYDDPAVAAWDPDLEALRKSERWSELIAPIEEHARARTKDIPALRYDWGLNGMLTSLSPDRTRLLLGRGGYGYLYGLPEREFIAVLSRAGERTLSASFSADGRYILRATDTDRFELWDGATGVFVREFEGTAGWQGYLVPCGPSGRVVGCGMGPYGQVGVWDGATGRLLRRLPVTFAAGVALSPDGTRALIVQDSTNGRTSAGLWDLESGAKLASHDDCGRPTFQCAFSPDGSLCFAMSEQRCRVVIYDGKTGAELRTIGDAGGRIRFARFHGRSRTLLVQTEAGSIQWIDPATGSVQRSVDIGKRAWGGMASDPTGNSILLTDPHEPYDGGSRFELLDAKTGESLWKRDSAHNLGWSGAGTFSADGSLLVFGSYSEVEIVETRTGQTVQRVGGPARSLSVLPIRDPRTCLLGTEDGALRRIDLTTGKAKASAEPRGAPARRLVSSRDGARVLLLRPDGQAAILDGEHLTPACELADSRALAAERDCSATFSPDGLHVALWSREQGVALWDARTGALERRVDSGLGKLEDLDWSGDSRLLALAAADGAVQVIDARSGARVGDPIRRDKPAGDDRFFSSVVRFAPDSQSLAISICDPIARICDLAGGKPRQEFSHKEDDWMGGVAVGDMAFSPDGTLLATTTVSFGSVYGWEAKTGRRLWRIDWGSGNPSPLYVHFDPAGARACTFGMGSWTPRIFDAKTGNLLVELKDRGLSQLDFSADGERMVASTGDSLQVLRASDGALLVERVEIEGGGALLRSASMHVDGTATALRRVQVLVAGSSCPLDSLAAVLLDPKRVRAAAAGIAVAPAIVPALPKVEEARVDPADRHTRARAQCAEGLLGFEVEFDGNLLDEARVQAATQITPDGKSAELDLEPGSGNAGTDPIVRISAVAKSGIASRPAFAVRRPAAK